MAETFPSSFWTGVDQFNQRQFYACHDTLEAIWMDSLTSEKNFYQGILQIAVALYHLGNHNWRGTVTLMGEGIYRLDNFQPSYGDVDVNALVSASETLLRMLQEGGAEEIEAIALCLDQADNTMSYPAITRLSEETLLH
ncbi:MAG: DUF309 domain-containing protein [Cyanobacteria bacterium P01_E01_bin.6]